MKKRLWLSSVFILTVLITSCAKVPQPQVPVPLEVTAADWVEGTLKNMTLQEKIGQMVAWSFSGDFRNRESEYIKDLENLIVHHKIGGFILFGGEVYDTVYIINALQDLSEIPLLLAADFERGVGNQITNSTLFPPLMALGAADSEVLAYEMGRITAIEGRAMGIHMTYAPVVDVNVNPDNPIINTRSVGEDPDLVTRISLSFIRGCQENGMIATAKHFPGHGDTDLDSHTLLPTISADRERLDAVELLPFQKAVDAGVEAIMTAHLFVPALDSTPCLPATLSPVILTDLLRGQLGFEGLIVTDALNMGGVTEEFTTEEAAVKSVMAGVDMLLIPPEPTRVLEALIQHALEGKIPMSRIDESVRRILKAKARLGLHKNKLVSVGDIGRKIAPKAHLDQAYRTFESSVTLVKNDDEVLPLNAEDGPLAVFSLSSDPGDYYAGRSFINEMRERAPELLNFFADGDTGRETLEEAYFASAGAKVVVFALFSRLGAWKGSVDIEPKHAALVRKFVEAEDGPRVVVLSFGSPYFLRHFPGVEVYMCLYRNTPQNQEIAARALFGEMDVTGRLPVSFPGLYPAGHGLVLKKAEGEK